MQQKPLIFLWTRSKLPLSLLIMWGLNERCSHFATVFDEKVVFHSNLLGAHLQWLGSFLSGTTQVVYQIKMNLTLEEQEECYQECLKVDKKSFWYDFGAFGYFCVCAFRYKFFGTPFPKTNKWQRNGGTLCTEMLRVAPKRLKDKMKIEDASIVSPEKLYEIMCKAVAELDAEMNLTKEVVNG